MLIMTTKLAPKDRKAQILGVAVKQAETDGYQNIERAKIAAAADISPGLVSKYFGTMSDLKRSVMRAAVRNGCLPVIAQGLALKDKQACKAPEELQRAALASLAP